MAPHLVFFGILAAVAVTGALAMVLSRNPVHSVLFLVVTLLSLATLFLTLDAEFLAALQVIVYAGAIMVLFLFVIMMLNLSPGNPLSGPLGGRTGFIVGGLLALELVAGIALALGSGDPGAPAPPGPSGTVESVGGLLMTRYVLPMELASLLLLAGMVGAIALSRPPRDKDARGAESAGRATDGRA